MHRVGIALAFMKYKQLYHSARQMFKFPFFISSKNSHSVCNEWGDHWQHRRGSLYGSAHFLRAVRPEYITPTSSAAMVCLAWVTGMLMLFSVLSGLQYSRNTCLKCYWPLRFFLYQFTFDDTNDVKFLLDNYLSLNISKCFLMFCSLECEFLIFHGLVFVEILTISACS